MNPRGFAVACVLGALLWVGAIAGYLALPSWARRAVLLTAALLAVMAWLWKLGTPPADAVPENHDALVKRFNADEAARARRERRAS